MGHHNYCTASGVSMHTVCTDIHLSSAGIYTSPCSVVQIIDIRELALSVHRVSLFCFFPNSHIIVVVPCWEAPEFISPLLTDVWVVSRHLV